jgi:uncharacterized Zn finger protein (UPF0148 family)
MASSQDRQGPDYLVCCDCGEPAFAWLTTVFCCPVCGCDTYEVPQDSEEDELEETSDEAGNEADEDRTEEVGETRKRKREEEVTPKRKRSKED